MAGVTTIRDVLYHYSFARGLYERFIRDCCEVDQQVVRNAMALLLWLDQGTNQLISQLPTMSTSALRHLLSEARWVIDCLHMRDLPGGGPPTPLLCALCEESNLDFPGFFPFDQGCIARGVAELLDGVCTLIFDDRLYHLLRRHQTGLVGRNPELEAPYAPIVFTVPEDCRSMFVTFSRGQQPPVERDEIFSYFRETWGDCIVRVLMEKTTGRAQPMYGRVIFKSKAFVSIVLNGEERAPVFIDGREIWLREYIPRPGNNN